MAKNTDPPLRTAFFRAAYVERGKVKKSWEFMGAWKLMAFMETLERYRTNYPTAAIYIYAVNTLGIEIRMDIIGVDCPLHAINIPITDTRIQQ